MGHHYTRPDVNTLLTCCKDAYKTMKGQEKQQPLQGFWETQLPGAGDEQ